MPKKKQKLKRGFNYIEPDDSEPVVTEPVDTELQKNKDTRGCYLSPLEALEKSMREVHIHSSKCREEDFQLVELPEERSGAFVSVKAICSSCNLDIYIDDPNRSRTSFREGQTLNSSLCLAAMVGGIDFNCLARFCYIIGLDKPTDSFDTYHNLNLHGVLSELCQSQLAENRKLSHTSRGSDGTKQTQISIKGDGTYQQKG